MLLSDRAHFCKTMGGLPFVGPQYLCQTIPCMDTSVPVPHCPLQGVERDTSVHARVCVLTHLMVRRSMAFPQLVPVHRDSGGVCHP